MARTLYSTALLLALLTCLYALPVKTLSEAEGAELSQLPAEEARELQLAGPTTPAEADAEAETEDGCSMEGDQDDEAIHTSLRRRCVGRERKLSWPWGRSRSKTEVEDTPSPDTLLAAEQQLHLANLMLIERIQDPTEKAAAREREYDRRRGQEEVLRQIR